MGRFTVVLPPASTVAMLCEMRNPGCSPRTSYWPVGSAGALKKPSELASAVRTRSVALLVIEIFANGMTAPDSSVTVPVMIPVGTCARAAKLVTAHISHIDLDVSDMLRTPGMVFFELQGQHR